MRGVATAPILLISGFAAFVVILGYAVVMSMKPRSTNVYEPSPIAAIGASANSLVVDTVTIDAVNTASWQFFDFDRGSVVLHPDTAGWDLAVRRFTVIAADAAADLGEIAFDDVDEVPGVEFVPTTFARDTTNAAIDRWYSYSMLTHVLEPKGHVYLVRTREARFAKIEFLSYYCPGVVAGCLTFRYVYAPMGETRFGK